MKKRMSHLQKAIGLACAPILALSLAAQTPPSDPVQARPTKFDHASVERGQKTFIANCGFCHGSRAKGGEKGPDLLRSVLVLDDEGGRAIGQVVLNGRPLKGMPKFALPPEQIVDIANFLHSSIADAADRDKYKVLNIVTGNAQAGRAYFTTHCSACHSATGDLKGIGAKYEPVTLQDHILSPHDRWGEPPAPGAQPLLTITVTLPSGQSVSGVPVTLDDFTVALRDPAGDYHSFTRTGDIPRVEIHNRLKAHSDMLMQYTDSDIHNLTAYLVTLK